MSWSEAMGAAQEQLEAILERALEAELIVDAVGVAV